MKRYNPKDIEPKWQKIWDETGVYTADLKSGKPKYIAMSMFNYPSGAGIHIGHAMNYTISDVKARFKRQQGYESYHPVGWDAFGLPAENYAIKAGVSPQESMATIIPDYHKQYKAMGWSNDWSKEIATHTPEYYKWTQWIFSQMYKNGLAYQDARMQWWCTKCQTVLASEQVIDGKCWRHDGPDDPIVEKKEVKQWFFKITDYADELLEAIDALDWTDSVKLAQKNWIGKSVGAEIDFALDEKLHYVLCHGFTARPDDGFHQWAKTQLEKDGHSIAVPALPNTDKPDAKEQAAAVLQTEKFDENSVLLGHSYGSVTALRIVEQLKKPIRKLVLVAGFAEPGFLDRERNFEKTTDWDFDFDKIKANVREIVIMRASNDSAVPPERANYLQQKLGGTIIDFKAEDDHATADIEPAVLAQLRPKITVFTTRPDTLFGATFMVLAPEHDLVGHITAPEQKTAVNAYVKEATKKTEVERQASKEKTGVFTGSYAINPANDEKIPIWIADYVLVGYGTGAIMAVPAHDERDLEFAEKFKLPVKQVVARHVFGTGREAPRDDLETLERPVVDAIITDGHGNYLLQIENEQHVHFVGGGIDDTDKTTEDALRREIIEEVGFTDILSIKQAAPYSAGTYLRETKNRNQKVWGTFFEVVINPSVQVKSEIEQGLHSIEWVKKDEVAQRLTWSGHKEAWQAYLDGKTINTETSEGLLVNSGEFDGVPSSDAREKIVAWLKEKGIGESKTMFKIRDWSVSRQRYWGAPIPIVNCEKCGTVLVPDEDLPVLLPELEDFKPSGDGRSALARAKDWLTTTCPNCDGPAERETDTLDTYICSSWYMYRYFDPHNQKQIFDSELVKKWEPIDFYNGADHATAHLLYARFIGHFFKKRGLVSEPEPFKQFLFNGKVTAADGQMFSKSKGNGVDPLEIINSGYGADALRTYLMFAAPLDIWIRWDPQGVPGTHRFLSRLWNVVQEYAEIDGEKTDDSVKSELLKTTHQMIRKMTEDIEENRYNTAIAAAMGALNDLYKLKSRSFAKDDAWQFALESIVACVAPFAPHIADELWQQLGNSSSIHVDSWPKWDEKYLVNEVMTIVIQVNGKVRSTLQVPAGSSEGDVAKAAQADEKAASYLKEKPARKVIYVPGKLINFVI